MLKDFVPADNGTEKWNQVERETEQRERETGRVRDTEEEVANEGLGDISLLNISSDQASNNADLENVEQWWEFMAQSHCLSLMNFPFRFIDNSSVPDFTYASPMQQCDTIWI